MLQKKIGIITAAIFGFLIIGVVIYFWQNQNRPTTEQINSSVITTTVTDNNDLSVCGDFPIASGDGEARMTRYYVCRDSGLGDCYYKKIYYGQIDGCDPEYTDENPFGNMECFSKMSDVYGFDGVLTESKKENYQVKDNCQITEQNYFESKIKE